MRAYDVAREGVEQLRLEASELAAEDLRDLQFDIEQSLDDIEIRLEQEAARAEEE